MKNSGEHDVICKQRVMAKESVEKLEGLFSELGLKSEIGSKAEIKHFFSGAALCISGAICAS